jgi:glycyl-tRNA synthetase
MFKTTIGPYKSSIGYARPEAAQGMFVDFKRVYETSRERLPIGIAQIGKALRNEISPRQGPIRIREFTIMEFEFFYDPSNDSCEKLDDVEENTIGIISCDDRQSGKEIPQVITIRDAINKGIIFSEWMAYFMALSTQFLIELGIPKEKQRFHEKLPYERAHYSKQTFDQEVLLDRWSWTEVAGFAHRSDYDLKRHMKYSKVDMKVHKPESAKMKFIPQVIEPSFGAERLLYTLLEYSLTKKDNRNILRIPKRLASYHIAIFPLLTKENLIIKAKNIFETLINNKFDAFYDEKGSIGRRYARADEIGIPLALTVDFQTLEDDTVTIRDRDSWEQVRVPVISLKDQLSNFYCSSINFKDIEKGYNGG